MMKGKKVSLIMPCLNEERALPAILEEAPECLDEVIVVDNGSTDKSVEVASKYDVTVVHEGVRGYGVAYNTGIHSARGDILALMDADGTYSLKDLEAMLVTMEKENLDFVSGCRFPLTQPGKTMPKINRAANVFISWLTTWLFGVRIKDSQSGLMALRKSLFARLNVENKSMGFSQELKIRAWLSQGARCKEQHIHYGMRIGNSKFQKLSDGFNNFWSLWKVYVRVKINRGR